VLFAVGVFIGCLAGLAAALSLDVSRRFVFERQTAPMVLALLALVVGCVALVESTRAHNDHTTPAAVAAPTTDPDPTSTTLPPETDATDTVGGVRVPNVLRLPEASALTILSHAGLTANVDTISLANVPAGFVMSQSPLPETTASAGTTVNLQVSARA
jgi:hypothetical protein